MNDARAEAQLNTQNVARNALNNQTHHRMNNNRNNYRTSFPSAQNLPWPNRTRANLKIGSLNVRGAGGNAGRVKWSQVISIMKREKLGLLVTQESHTQDDDIDMLNKTYEPKYNFVHTYDRENTGSKGIVIIVNRQNLPDGIQDVREIIHGRAITASIKWRDKTCLSILAVYAPNDARENKEFWENLNSKWTDPESTLPEINVMMGDFNLVEEAIDRHPPHADSAEAVGALNTLKWSIGGLQDGWRQFNPTPSKAFTYSQVNRQGTSLSRIDRIYCNESIYNQSIDWGITTPGALQSADHELIWTIIDNKDLPRTGRGRWRIPTFLVSRTKFTDEIEGMGMKLLEDLEGQPESANPARYQNALQTFIEETTSIAKRICKNLLCSEDTVRKKCEEEIKKIRSSEHDLSNHEINELKILRDKIQNIDRRRLQRTQSKAKAKDSVYGETICRAWTSRAKGQTLREITRSLRIPGSNPPRYIEASKEMAEMTAEYHDELQDEIENPESPEKESATQICLNSISPITHPELKDLDELIKYDDIVEAIRRAPNEKAPGLNGMISELYKHLHDRWIAQRDAELPGFNIVRLLRLAFNEIETNGILNTKVTEGWLCPIHKKGDKREVINYRPITILNAEYKIMTTVLMLKLIKVAPSAIDMSQAGFLPGRSIHNQIDLMKRMIDLCQATDQNGMIIALDQEKAYDKIQHDYLWKVLERFGLPALFIATVKTLYTNAETRVIVNGEISKPFKVRRGVRQGDPLSCLLFIIAIEPLSTLIRSSDKLNGLEIRISENKIQRAIVSLFADDTTVFLRETDALPDLFEILDTWCQASGARFNIRKTVIIPVGNENHRSTLVTSRRPSSNANAIADNITILADKTPTRILGAMIGNKIDYMTGWPTILEKISKSL